MALNDHLSRKSVLINLLTLPIAATAAVAMVGEASADSKSPKSAVQYQSKPKGAARCDNCKFWVPGKTAKAKGKCTVVAGDIDPSGWCVVYSKK